MSSVHDLERLRLEYADRDHQLAGSDRYALYNKPNLFLFQQRQRELVAFFHHFSLFPLGNKRVLEMGCGTGQVMHELLGFGATPEHLHGIDLLEGHLRAASKRLAHLSFLCADGQNIPYQNDTFDLVLQFTAFSSILDSQVKMYVAKEMLRVLAPTGVIVWYDFWTNPLNRQTHGIRPAEIRQLFPDCEYYFRKITLAPPISRRLVSVSWLMCYCLEKLKALNTHYLVGIQKQSH